MANGTHGPFQRFSTGSLGSERAVRKVSHLGQSYARSVLKVSNGSPRLRTDGSKGFPPWPMFRTVRSKGFQTFDFQGGPSKEATSDREEEAPGCFSRGPYFPNSLFVNSLLSWRFPFRGVSVVAPNSFECLEPLFDSQVYCKAQLRFFGGPILELITNIKIRGECTHCVSATH